MELNEIVSGRRSIRRDKAGTEVDPALILSLIHISPTSVLTILPRKPLTSCSACMITIRC